MTPGAHEGSVAGSLVLPVPGTFHAEVATPANPLSGYSRFAQRLRRRYARELPLLAAGAPDATTMAAAYCILRQRGSFVQWRRRVPRPTFKEITNVG